MAAANKKALLLVSLAMLLIDTPAAACGWSLSTGGLLALLGVIALLAAIPIALASAGLIAALRIRRAGRLSFGKVLFTGLAGLMELSLAQACGCGSLIGLACLGAISLQAIMLIGAVTFGRPLAPLPGVLTLKADGQLFAQVPR